MKKQILLSLIFVMFIATQAVFSQVKTEKIKVSGNCDMCKARIEKAANSVDGITGAVWDQETKILLVNLDPAKTNVEKVQKTVAAAGHDTDKFKAEKSVYDKLPGCCKYR
jgi:periplasmic mercuric ion binding protein